ncbi:hypothetical protein J3R83DRAFT_11095 [Lanmaoa asiatica]|nr:hypothetical protein J3R83DRAFT_11095 [Lanmaoa asiatica]
MTTLRVPSSDASDIQGEKQIHLREIHAHALSTKEVHTGAQTVAGLSTQLDPAESARVRFAKTNSSIVVFLLLEMHTQKKIDYHILPMICSEF